MAYMAQPKRIAGVGVNGDQWGPAFKESGLEFVAVQRAEDASSPVDCWLVDLTQSRELPDLSKGGKAPVLSLVQDDVDRSELMRLRKKGVEGCIARSLPAEEVIVRIRAMLDWESKRANPMESRSAKRIWFQQKVDFKIFDRSHAAWSTTLSETGIFLRTHLSFPLYSVMHLQFQLLGEATPFEADGVIVREETEGAIQGMGVMFQNLSGESVRRLESFLDIYR